MEISQNAEISKKKIVKDEKPTNRDSKGRFFRGSPSAFKGKKHSKKTKEKMSKSRNEYFQRVDMNEYRKYHIGKKQTEKTIKKRVDSVKKKWAEDKEWAKKRRNQIKKQNQDPRIRVKISKALKGKPKSEAHNKKVSEAIKKWWKNRENRKRMTGKNAFYWKGGITPLRKLIRHCAKYKEWRLSIMERDNYTCQKCNKRGGWLEVDHYPESFSDIFHKNNIKTLEEALSCKKFWEIENGRTLCKKCHINN